MFQFNQPIYRPSQLIFIKPDEVDAQLVENIMQREVIVKAEQKKHHEALLNECQPFSQWFNSPIKVKVICTKKEVHMYDHVYRYEEQEIVERHVTDINKRDNTDCPYE